MSKFLRWTPLLVAFVSVLYLAGCNGGTETTDNTPANTEEGHDHEGHDHDGHDHEGHDHETGDHEGDDHETGAEDKVSKAMSELSEEDRKLAEAQKICPVGGDSLGSMGKPHKVTLDDGKVVFVCCDGCEEPLKADPEKYLAKLEK